MSRSAQQKLAEALRLGQNQSLKMVAKNTPLTTTLEHLMRLIEGQSAGVLCSVLLLDESGEHLLSGAAPSLPQGFCDAIHGVTIGPCSAAIFAKRTASSRS